MSLNLRFSGLDLYGHATFTTFGTPDKEKSNRILSKMDKKMKKSYVKTPIWVSSDGTCKLTLRDRNLKLCDEGLYEVNFSLKCIDSFVNAWKNGPLRLISRADRGVELNNAFFDDSDDDE
jgi:hypothetical protein